MRTSDWSSDVCSSDLRVGVADRRLEKSLGIRGRIGRHDLEAGDMSVPAGIVLAVLGRDPGGCAVRAAEHDRASHLTAGHVEGLGGGIDDLVDRLHREVEGHELDDGPRSEEHTSELQSLMRNSYAVF